MDITPQSSVERLSCHIVAASRRLSGEKRSEEKDENIMRMQEPIYSQAQKIKVEEKYPQKPFIEKKRRNTKKCI